MIDFSHLPAPRERPCDRCSQPTFERFCDHCACDEINAQQREHALALLDTTVPSSFRLLGFKSPRVRAIGMSLNALAESLVGERNVVLVGPPGAGKTTLAVAMLRERVERMGTEAIFVRAHRLGVARIQHAAGDGEAASVEAAMRTELVLLDDVGNERQTATNAIPDVILHRAEEGLATWVTTFLAPREAAEKYGGGVARRIFEQAKVIRLGEQPRRISEAPR